jgi:prepilin-type N-terminal cleavage/methylation domain-containing protein
VTKLPTQQICNAANGVGRTVPRIRARRGFSMVEMLIAFMISSLLMTACLVALDSSFKSYEATTESASTHVVSRLVMHRVMAMIRQGEEFGPFPIGVVTPTKIESDYIEFVSLKDDATGKRQVTRLEKTVDPQASNTYQLQYRRWDYLNGTLTQSFSYPLIRNLKEAHFTLEYDIGPRLIRATVDLSIKPEDVSTAATNIHTELQSPVLRLVASASPRRLDE